MQFILNNTNLRSPAVKKATYLNRKTSLALHFLTPSSIIICLVPSHHISIKQLSVISFLQMFCLLISQAKPLPLSGLCSVSSQHNIQSSAGELAALRVDCLIFRGNKTTMLEMDSSQGFQGLHSNPQQKFMFFRNFLKMEHEFPEYLYLMYGNSTSHKLSIV